MARNVGGGADGDDPVEEMRESDHDHHPASPVHGPWSCGAPGLQPPPVVDLHGNDGDCGNGDGDAATGPALRQPTRGSDWHWMLPQQLQQPPRLNSRTDPQSECCTVPAQTEMDRPPELVPTAAVKRRLQRRRLLSKRGSELGCGATERSAWSKWKSWGWPHRASVLPSAAVEVRDARGGDGVVDGVVVEAAADAPGATTKPPPSLRSRTCVGRDSEASSCRFLSLRHAYFARSPSSCVVLTELMVTVVVVAADAVVATTVVADSNAKWASGLHR